MEVINQDNNLFYIEDDDYPTPIIVQARYNKSDPGKPIKYGTEGIIDWGEPKEDSYVDIECVWIKTRQEEIVCSNLIVLGSIDEYKLLNAIEKYIEEME